MIINVVEDFLILTNPYYSKTLCFIETYGLARDLEQLGLPVDIKNRLALVLMMNYKRDGYHSIFHALNVATSTKKFLESMGHLSGYVLAGTIAALLHDINRPNDAIEAGATFTDFDFIQLSLDFAKEELKHSVYDSIQPHYQTILDAIECTVFDALTGTFPKAPQSEMAMALRDGDLDNCSYNNWPCLVMGLMEEMHRDPSSIQDSKAFLIEQIAFLEGCEIFSGSYAKSKRDEYITYCRNAIRIL